MGLIPKAGEQKEPVGFISLMVAHYFFGLGIAILGQRTKNVAEFWLGAVACVASFGFLAVALSGFASIDAFWDSFAGLVFGLFSLATWMYIVGRLLWIAIRKETRITIL